MNIGKLIGRAILIVALVASMYLSLLLAPVSVMRAVFGADAHVFGWQVWRLVTYMWVHESWNHLIDNCFALVLFGLIALRYYSTKTWLMIYMLSGILAGLTVVYVHPWINLVGASGAVLGLHGLAIAGAWRCRKMGISHIFLAIALIFLFVIGTFMDLGTPHVSALCHFIGALVGFVTGMEAPMIFNKVPPAKR
jgi:membrane associated rhomboid family serine protease